MGNNFLIEAEIVFKGGDDKDPRSEEFEKAFLDVMEERGAEIEAQDPNVLVERYYLPTLH